MEIGEQVETYFGQTKRITGQLPRPGPQLVYNLEVYGEHVYFVGEQGLAAHNAYDSRYVYALFKENDLIYIGTGNHRRALGAENALKRIADAKFGGDLAMAKSHGYRVNNLKLASEFEARGMEQKLIDYFGGPTYGNIGHSWATIEPSGLLNKNVSWKWIREDKRAKLFKKAYLNEDLFAKTMATMFN